MDGHEDDDCAAEEGHVVQHRALPSSCETWADTIEGAVLLLLLQLWETHSFAGTMLEAMLPAEARLSVASQQLISSPNWLLI